MQAVLDGISYVDLACVVTNNSKALGVKKARRMGIPIRIFKKSDSWLELSSELKTRGVTHIFLMGFMRILPAGFIAEWPGRIANIHPSLLPSYPGVSSIERAFADGAPLGITVHRVIPEVDAGEILWQKAVRRYENLERATFGVHLWEHQMVRKVFEKWSIDLMS